jgi:hypothetical protein
MLRKFWLTVIAVMGISGICIASDNAVQIKDLKLQLELTHAPDISYHNYKAFAPETPSVNKWVMLRVEFVPERKRVSEYVSVKNVKVSVPAWADDVKLDAKVLFDTGMVRGGKKYVLFTGKTVSWSIRQDGERHLALMFIPAKQIDRYFVPVSGSKVSAKSFKAVVEMSAGGKVLKRAFYDVIGGTDAVRMRNFDKLAAQSPKIADAVISRSRSPWALLAPDNFDLEKDANGMGVTQE